MDKTNLLKGALFLAGHKAIEDFIDGGLERSEQEAVDAINGILDDVMAQMPEEEFDLYFEKYVGKEELRVDVPDGQIVAYPSNDPDYPGIHIERAKDGYSYMLNLTTVEYKVEEKQWVTHVWGNAQKEDTTHDIVHKNESSYFDQ